MKLHFISYLVYAVLLAVAEAKDYYDILGLNKHANEREIKSAYRQLSLQYHPDKNNSPEAHDKFVEVGEAYEVLSNSEKKKNYDQYGDPDGPARGGHNMDFGGMFNQFFGGGHPGGHHQGKRRGENAQLFLDLALVDFYRGKDIDFDVEMWNICSHCEGTGSEDQQKHTCSKCNGEGIITFHRQLGMGMTQTFRSHCDECGGKGTKITHPCHQCEGRGVRKEGRNYNVHVDKGFPRDGQQVLHGEGDEAPDTEPGDLLVNMRETLKESWGYRRVGDNLYRTEVLTAREALLGGWERSIPFFDTIDTEIKLARAAHEMVMDGEVEVLAGKGMPVYSGNGLDDDRHGDLYIEYTVIYPAGAKKEAMEALRDEL